MGKGAERVVLHFNPSGDNLVENYKRSIADLIDQLEVFHTTGNSEISRCASIAQTKLEEACMWAVKTITK
jgi:hypothetical protein